MGKRISVPGRLRPPIVLREVSIIENLLDMYPVRDLGVPGFNLKMKAFQFPQLA